eukprot:EG_transcript_13551
MKVLITGGLGFLGSQLASLILRKGSVSNGHGQLVPVETMVLFDVAQPAPNPQLDAVLAHPAVQVATGDITDPVVCAKLVDCDDMSVFHLAGVMSGQGEADFDLAWRVNVLGAKNLLEACRARQCHMRFLFASTIAVFGATDGQTGADDTKLRPLNTYGMTKAACELLINDMTRKGFVDGRVARLPTVIVRPGRPNAATTSCFSGIVREPLAGVDVEVPVASDLQHAVIGHRGCVQALLDLHEVPAATMAAVCGVDRAVNLPSISTTLAELADEMRVVAAEKGIRPGLVSFAPDPFLCSVVGSMAARTEYARSLKLGLRENPTIREIILQYLEDFGVAGSALYQKA